MTTTRTTTIARVLLVEVAKVLLKGVDGASAFVARPRVPCTCAVCFQLPTFKQVLDMKRSEEKRFLRVL